MKLMKAGTSDAVILVAISKHAFDSDVEVGSSSAGGPPGYKSTPFHMKMARTGNLYKLVDDHGLIVGGAVLFPEQDRIRVACGRETARETVSLLERFLQDGMMSLRMGEEQTEASKLLALLAEQASDVNLLLNPAAAGAREENEKTENKEDFCRMWQEKRIDTDISET